MQALEDNIVAQAKKAGKYGKIGLKALSAFIKPIANQAAAVAKGAGKWGIQHIGGAISGVGKFLGSAAGGLTTGVKDLLGGIKGEKDLRKLAEEKPEEFKKIHSSYVEKFKGMGLPVSDAASAAAFIGVSETDDGRAAVEAAAKKGGVSLDDLNSQLNFFGQMVKHLDVANKSAAGVKSESKTINLRVTKSQLRQIIKESLLVEEPADYYKDYKAGTITKKEYEELVRQYNDRSQGGPPTKASSSPKTRPTTVRAEKKWKGSKEELTQKVHQYLIDIDFYKGFKGRDGKMYVDPFSKGSHPKGGYTSSIPDVLKAAVKSGEIDWATYDEMYPVYRAIDRSID